MNPHRPQSGVFRFAQTRAEMTFVGSLTAFLSRPGKKVINLVFMDGSSSLDDYQVPLCEGLNAYLTSLKQPQLGVSHAVMVVKIQDDYSILVPFTPAENLSPLTHFTTAGCTLLWLPVYRLVRYFTTLFKDLSDEQRRDLQIVFCLNTDGEDNRSDKTVFPRRLVEEVKIARAMGFEFYVNGYRINAAYSAGIMGMPTDGMHAKTFAKTSEGIHASSVHMTSVSRSFFSGVEFDPPATDRP